MSSLYFLTGFWLGIAVYQDVWNRRIPNWLTVPAAIAGVLFHTLFSGFPEGTIPSFQGAIVGFFLSAPPYLLGGVGGGDVKLLCAAGAWLGPAGIVYVFLFGSLWGGAMAMAVMLPLHWPGEAFPERVRRWAFFMEKTAADVRSRGIPYAVPMVLAAFTCLLFGLLD